MIKGSIVEYIDRQKIISAVILQENGGKLKLLNENNREVSFSEKRLSHVSQVCLDTALARNSIVDHLKALTENRKKLAQTINIKELWEILHEDGEDIDISAMTLFCFNPPLTADHESAVIRAFFKDRRYFKFNKMIFAPYTPEQVEVKKKQIKKAEKRDRLIKAGSAWINHVMDNKNGSGAECKNEQVIEILKSYYLFQNDSDSYLIARQILKRSRLKTIDQLFQFFVKAGIWDQNENVDLHLLGIPDHFSDLSTAQEKTLIEHGINFLDDPLRQDLTHVSLITIDGQSTLDVDDAISLENTETGYALGIHIIDVDAYIKKNDPIDLVARERGSSIYMPDDKLPMIPAQLSEDLCSLKEGEIRPAISTIVTLSCFFEILDYKIIPSIIKVRQQMSYAEANLLNGKNDPVTTLYKIATRLRENRLKAGALQITLPEVNVWIEENLEIGYSKVDRENPSRMLVSEMMIFANSLMAEFLAKHNTPAIFRSQAPPKQRLFNGIETSLLLNFMQRKHLSRAIISAVPENHSGLGVNAYVTATSPIRRYYDLVNQRQIKSLIGYDNAYSKNALEDMLQTLTQTVANAGRVQAARRQYWILKYLESQKGNSFESLILDCHRDHYNVLIKEFMLETTLSAQNGIRLMHGDVVQLTIQHADARRDQLSLCV